MNRRALCRGTAASNLYAKIREALNPSHMNRVRLALSESRRKWRNQTSLACSAQ
jgi:hypothetical protein